VSVNIEIELIHPNAHFPSRMTPGSSGYDLYAVEDQTISNIRPQLVRTGLRLAIPRGIEGQIRPRSGLASKQGVAAVLGTIDSDYRGEVKVLLTVLPFHENDILYAGVRHYQVKAGDRIAQIVFSHTLTATFEQRAFAPLPATQRGTHGFGSTGD